MCSQKWQWLASVFFAVGLVGSPSVHAQDTPNETIKLLREEADARLRSIQIELDEESKSASDSEAKNKMLRNSTLKMSEEVRPAAGA